MPVHRNSVAEPPRRPASSVLPSPDQFAPVEGRILELMAEWRAVGPQAGDGYSCLCRSRTRQSAAKSGSGVPPLFLIPCKWGHLRWDVEWSMGASMTSTRGPGFNGAALRRTRNVKSEI